MTRYASPITPAEAELIHAYLSADGAVQRAPIIRRYAEMTHLSLGRAEDALDLWAHLVEQHRQDIATHRLSAVA